MNFSRYSGSLILSLFALVACATAAESATKLVVQNTTNTSTYVVVKFPPTSGCGPTKAHQLKVTDMTVPGHSMQIPVHNITNVPNLGYFPLLHKHKVQVQPASPLSCLATINFAFLTIPQCPCGTNPNLPSGYNKTCTSIANPFGPSPGHPVPNQTNGVNLAEVTLNVSSQETVDISCNQGANASIAFSLSGGPGWTNGITTFSNLSVDIVNGVDNNCSVDGVFPYNQSTCDGGGTSCANQPLCTQAADTVCQVQRVGSGGTVTISFNGAL